MAPNAGSDSVTGYRQNWASLTKPHSTCGFDYSRIMKADADAQSDLIEGMVETLQHAVQRYDSLAVRSPCISSKGSDVHLLQSNILIEKKVRSLLLQFEGKPLPISLLEYANRILMYSKIRFIHHLNAFIQRFLMQAKFT